MELSGDIDIMGQNNVINCVRIVDTNASRVDDGGLMRCRGVQGCQYPLAENVRIEMDINGKYGSGFSAVTPVATYRRLHGDLGCDGAKVDGGLMDFVFIDDRKGRTPLAGYAGGTVSNATIRDYCQTGAEQPHSDGNQSCGMEGPTWWYRSRVEGAFKYVTSSMFFGCGGVFDDLTIDSSWFQGGNFTFYYNSMVNSSFTNNRIV
jgi:hypothetical protein